jgi:diguanylate cyclase (GGDEF)-like protein
VKQPASIAVSVTRRLDDPVYITEGATQSLRPGGLSRGGRQHKGFTAVALFTRDLDESFADPKNRSLLGLRLFAFVATAIAAGAGAGAAIALDAEPVVGGAAAAVVGGFGLLMQMLFWRAEHRFRKEQQRLHNLWLSRRAQIQELAGRDELTQLQNRRFFYEQMEQELDLAIRYKRDLSILMMDVDDLKLINDEFGHQVGDVVLRNFGRVLNQQAGEKYITARIGGDEFAVILPGADRKAADKLSWAVWETLSKEPICETEHASIFLGVSIGIGGYPWGGKDLEEIIHWADTKLYANKL